MDTVVFIPTRNRMHCLEKVLPKWQEQKNVDKIYIVCEKWEFGRHRRLAGKFENVEAVRLPKTHQGVSYSRRKIVELAAGLGLDYMIMADDDLYPRPKDDVQRLFEFGDLNTLGIGIMLPFYGLTFGNQTIKDSDEPLLMANAMGKRLFSLDIEKVLSVGNFDANLHTFGGDNELVRDGIKQLEAVWYVHAGVNGTSIGKRHEPGGLNGLHHEDAIRRELGEKDCHERMYRKWGPKYISNPTSRFMCHWKRMLDDFVPSWRELQKWVKK